MKQQEENLSRILDGDEAAEIDAAIDEVVADVNLQYRMRRYQMIGEVMRNELPAAINTGFHADVMARVRAEAAPDPAPLPSAKQADRPALFGWLKPLAGMAVAAGVAVVTVALWQPQQGGNDAVQIAGNTPEISEKIAIKQSEIEAVPVSVQVDGMRWKMHDKNGSDDLQRKLNAYLVNHTEYSNSMQGLIPQARVAGFDAQQQ